MSISKLNVCCNGSSYCVSVAMHSYSNTMHNVMYMYVFFSLHFIVILIVESGVILFLNLSALRCIYSLSELSIT